jgi:hypothetical protein
VQSVLFVRKQLFYRLWGCTMGGFFSFKLSNNCADFVIHFFSFLFFSLYEMIYGFFFCTCTLEQSYLHASIFLWFSWDICMRISLLHTISSSDIACNYLLLWQRFWFLVFIILMYIKLAMNPNAWQCHTQQ